MTQIYSISYCWCGWQSPVQEGPKEARVRCPNCRRELWRAHATEMEDLDDIGKARRLAGVFGEPSAESGEPREKARPQDEE